MHAIVFPTGNHTNVGRLSINFTISHVKKRPARTITKLLPDSPNHNYVCMSVCSRMSLFHSLSPIFGMWGYFFSVCLHTGWTTYKNINNLWPQHKYNFFSSLLLLLLLCLHAKLWLANVNVAYSCFAEIFLLLWCSVFTISQLFF
jgi:hypothetical protein